MEEKYIVAKYARLSLADGDDNDSQSIVNQIGLIDEYISKNKEFIEAYEYIDDGYTGGNFERPSFKRLLEDINAGKINCIIVKDFSRLGRDHIGMGYYIEKFFPMNKIRFISLLEKIDTNNQKSIPFLSFKLSFNDYYIQDISKKVKSVKKRKMELGEYQSGIPPYGYKKDTKEKNHLIIDENVAPVVKEIFEMYAIKNINMSEIARILNDRNIEPSRSIFKCSIC